MAFQPSFPRTHGSKTISTLETRPYGQTLVCHLRLLEPMFGVSWTSWASFQGDLFLELTPLGGRVRSRRQSASSRFIHLLVNSKLLYRNIGCAWVLAIYTDWTWLGPQFASDNEGTRTLSVSHNRMLHTRIPS